MFIVQVWVVCMQIFKYINLLLTLLEGTCCLLSVGELCCITEGDSDELRLEEEGNFSEEFLVPMDGFIVDLPLLLGLTWVTSIKKKINLQQI